LRITRGTFTLSGALLFAAHGLMAGQLNGGWEGTLDVGITQFRVVLTLQEGPKGGLSGNFANIDDGLYDQPLRILSSGGDRFQADLPTGEMLDLHLNPSRTLLEGSYYQAHGSFQEPGRVSKLVLEKGADFQVPRLGPDGAPRTVYSYRVPRSLDDGWDPGDIRSLGGEPASVEAGVRKILDGSFPHVHSLVVVKNGKLVLDEYFYGYGPKDSHPVQSATKSVFSALVGIAQAEGYLNLKDKLYDHFPEYRSKGQWEKGKDKITLRELLTMTSGLGCDDWKDAKACSWSMVSSPDWLDFSLSLPLSQDPGRHFAYCGACLTPLSALIARQSGMPVEIFATKYLFTPLRIQNFHWMEGPGGIYPASFGIAMRPRDLAKIGYLYLNKGVWGGKTIVPPQWVATSVSPLIPKSETNGLYDYGYLWWGRTIHRNRRDFRVFFAWGVGGQCLFVAPKLNLVCVVTGGNYRSPKLGANAFKLFQDYVVGAFL
jgi:CubicO group peptidase (beta-lactamase class C family)